METRGEQRSIVWGLLLIVLGLLLLAGNLGYKTWIAWDRWWPLLLIALGVVLLYRRNGGDEPTAAPPAEGPQPPGAEMPGPVAPAPSEPQAAGDGEASPPRRYPTAAIVLIGIGVAFLLDDLVGGNAFPAVVLIAIGLALILRDRR